MTFSATEYRSLLEKPGIYQFFDVNKKILYVGKAKDLKSRVSSYFVNANQLGPKTKALVAQIQTVTITIVESELEALLLEAFYIKKFTPKYNILLKDSKMYVMIRITMGDAYPKVLLSRRQDDPKSLYFGPYPNAFAVRTVLKTIRKIFPYQSIMNHPKRVCLYNHLGLCPCPPMFDTPELRKAYRKNIRGIIRMLEGESPKIMKELEKQRDAASKREAYEEALLIQKKIVALQIITEPFHRPIEYDVNPNLRIDLRTKELEELRSVLNREADFLLKKLERIECYDISNIQGTNATASMVVLTNGEIDKTQYRKFKIRRDWEKQKSKKDVILEGGKRPRGSHIKDSIVSRRSLQNDKPNDFAMMQEALRRRLKHDEWQTPDLIIVDGGKGQVSSAMGVLAELQRTIPLIGLAKREETIVIPKGYQVYQTYQRHQGQKSHDTHDTRDTSNSFFTEVSLPKNSPALQLIMRIRDEAHRFAITYHRKLRSTAALTSS